MRKAYLIVLALAVSPASAQVRGAPAVAPAGPGMAGAVGAAAGAVGTLPGSPLPVPAALGPLPALLAPVRLRFAPADASPAPAASAAMRAPSKPAAPMAPGREREAGASAARPDLVPPEQGLVLPRAAPAMGRHAAASRDATRRSDSTPRQAGRGKDRGSWSRAGGSLRLVATWLRPSAADDLVGALDSLFAGRLAGDRRAGTQAGAAGRPSSNPIEADLPNSPNRRSARGAPPRQGLHSGAASPLGSRAGASLAAPTAGPAPSADARPSDGSPRRLRGARFAGVANDPRLDAPSSLPGARNPAALSAVDATRAGWRFDGGSPPRLLRLGRPEPPSGPSGMGLRIEDSPARARAVGADEASKAAAEALARRPQEPPYSDDRVLRNRETPPLPPASRDHGWLAFWTAAAASRVVIARSF